MLVLSPVCGNFSFSERFFFGVALLTARGNMGEYLTSR